MFGKLPMTNTKQRLRDVHGFMTIDIMREIDLMHRLLMMYWNLKDILTLVSI